MVGHHAGDRPDALRGTGEHLLRPGLPHPAGTLAPELARVGPAARRRRSRDAGQASAPGDGRPRGSRARPTAAPSPPRQARCRRPPARGHRGYLDPLRPAGGPPPQPLQVQRDADRAAAVRGQRRPVRPDTGHRTLDVRSTGWTDVPRRDRGADRATTSVAGVRTSSRRRPPAGRPDLTRVTAPGGARPPGRPRGDGTCAGALTAATDSCPAPPGMRPRPGALLSSEEFGLRVGRRGGCHPVHTRKRRMLGVPAGTASKLVI